MKFRIWAILWVFSLVVSLIPVPHLIIRFLVLLVSCIWVRIQFSERKDSNLLDLLMIIAIFGTFIGNQLPAVHIGH